MSTKWICLNCDSVNDKESSFCNQCNSPHFWSGLAATAIKNGSETIYSKQPTIWLLDEVAFRKGSKRKLSKCPSCTKLMFISDIACPHCCHVLSEPELENRVTVNRYGAAYYIKSIIIWGLIIWGLSYLAS
jgi:hypothetical protein